MYSNILIAIDPMKIEASREAVKTAKYLSKEGAEITILTVIEEPPEYFSKQISGEIEHEVRSKIAAELQLFADKFNIGGKIVILKGHAFGSIIDHQTHNKNDLVIITSHTPSEKDHLMSATALNVVRSAKCPVFVLR